MKCRRRSFRVRKKTGANCHDDKQRQQRILLIRFHVVKNTV